MTRDSRPGASSNFVEESVMVTSHRTYLRLGGVWLLFAALAHTAWHFFTFVPGRSLDPSLIPSIDALVATPAGAELWVLFHQFSLAFALFLLLAGTASVIASRRNVGIREARHWSGFAGGFWLMAFVVFLLEPVAPALIIAGTAAFFHLVSYFAAASERSVKDAG